MADTQIQNPNQQGIYFSRMSKVGNEGIKLKLGLAELLFQALILFLLVFCL